MSCDRITPPDAAACDRLRRIAVGRETSADRDWLAERVGLYLDHAAEGLRIEDALDLAVPPGGEPWWRTSARAERDAALREFAARTFPGLSPFRQAIAMSPMVKRYEASAWLRDRNHDDIPLGYVGTPKACLWRAFRAGVGVPGGVRQLQTILSAETGRQAADFVAVDSRNGPLVDEGSDEEHDHHEGP